MTQLNLSRPPRLPTAPQEYQKQFHDQHSDVLRLYLSQADNAINALIGLRGTKYLNAPYAAVQRTSDKLFTANTATQITFDQTDAANGCVNDGTDGIVVNQPGLYNYQFSVQLKNTDTQIHSAWIWLRKNGVDLPGTGSKFDITSSHGGIPGHVIAACNFFVTLQQGDSVEMLAAVDDATATFEATPAQTTPFAMPAIPSVVVTLSFVSNLTA